MKKRQMRNGEITHLPFLCCGNKNQSFLSTPESAEFIAEEDFHNLLLLKNGERASMDRMFSGLSRICAIAKKPVVMMIDEVDSASNNQVFIDFLAQFRGHYLNRENNPTFQSVILAGGV